MDRSRSSCVSQSSVASQLHALFPYETVNLDSLEKKLPAGKYSSVDLVQKRMVSKGKAVKILARGAITKKYDLEAHAASKTAKDAVKKAGGSITIVKSAH